MLKPIKAGTYFVNQNKKVFIFTDHEPEEIIFKDKNNEPVQISDFFKIGEDVYISRIVSEDMGDEGKPDIQDSTYHYKQSKGKIIDISEKPQEKPIQNYSSYTSDNWIVKKTAFEDGFVSDIKNQFFKGGARFRHVFGCFEIETGLFFNVLESGKPGLQEGLYFFPVERTSCSRVQEKGEIW